MTVGLLEAWGYTSSVSVYGRFARASLYLGPNALEPFDMNAKLLVRTAFCIKPKVAM